MLSLSSTSLKSDEGRMMAESIEGGSSPASM